MGKWTGTRWFLDFYILIRTILRVDKLYITHSEWATEYGGAKANSGRHGANLEDFKGLPHDCCALTFVPFRTPVCSPTGHVFELTHILDYLDKHQKNPVTGEPMQTGDLQRLEYARNAAGELFCPVTLKSFTDHSHIVAVRGSGRVYSAEGLAELAVAGKEGAAYCDFFTDEPFTKYDLITLQEPKQLERRNINTFKHVQADKSQGDVSHKRETLSTPSGTSTVSIIAPPPEEETTAQDLEKRMFKEIKVNGKATIRTNYGDLHLELFTKQAPRTTFNFITLARRGYYAGVPFHRLVRGFVLQGGDPSGTGSGGQSCWGTPFATETSPRLTHSKRGILSMANKGDRRSNTSQFFITLQPAPHLDGLHPVFGKVVGGEETLDAIERVPVDSSSRPLKPIIMQDVIIAEDPFEAFHRKESEKMRREDPSVTAGEMAKKSKVSPSTHTATTIGKYMARAQAIPSKGPSSAVIKRSA